MENERIFSERIKKLRKEKGLTQEELGSVLGRTKYNISNYELGRRQPDNDTLRALAKFFDVSVDYLLGESNVRHQHDVLAFHTTGDLTEEEWEEIKNYIDFVRSKRDD
jgi:transcriptional regulator with XRE-family HTH domain